MQFAVKIDNNMCNRNSRYIIVKYNNDIYIYTFNIKTCILE